MNFLERIERLRADYRRREKTAADMVADAERRYDAHNPDDYTTLKRLKTKHSLYREFADELDAAIKTNQND